MTRIRKRWVILGLLAVPPLLLLYACQVEPYWIELTRHDVGSGAREIRILHLSDLHFTTAGSRERRVLEIIDEEKPDLIVITGDSISTRPSTPAATRPAGTKKAGPACTSAAASGCRSIRSASGAARKSPSTASATEKVNVYASRKR